MPKDSPRATVRKFFAYSKAAKTPWWFWPTMIAAAIGWFYVHDQFPEPAMAVIGMVFTVVALSVLSSIDKAGQRRRGRRELGQLANKSRAIQSKDAVDAFLRVFKRSKLDIEDLRTLDNRYEFEKERDLFSESSLEDRLGEIYNKSIRMWSQGDSKAMRRFRRVVWDSGNVEDFYNPLRIVALFLSSDEMVICDTEIDSIDGDLKENISRVMLTDIVSIGFKSERIRFTMSIDEIVALAEDMKYSKAELKKIREVLSGRDETDPEYIQEEIVSWLEITRKDSGALSFPIRKHRYFGKRRSAIDDDSALNEDDETIDAMMNELNRLVRSSKIATAGN